MVILNNGRAVVALGVNVVVFFFDLAFICKNPETNFLEILK